MTWTLRFRDLTLLSLTVLLPIVASPVLSAPAPAPAPQRISLKFKVPDRGSPPVTAGGASRGACLPGAKMLKTLVPTGNVGLTISDHPSFFVAVPRSLAKTGELLLLSQDGKDVVYQTTFDLPTTPGIVRFTLPQDAPALQAGKRYHWFFSLNCSDTLGASVGPTVDGWIDRVEPSAELSKALQAALPADRPTLYAESGLWHETLTALADLHEQAPSNLKVIADWRSLLKSVGLSMVADEPLVDCCTMQTVKTNDSLF